MKIVQINTVYEYGSTGRNCKELQSYLIAQGHECVTICATGKPDKNVYPIVNKLERKITAVLSRVCGLYGHFAALSTYRIIKLLEKIKPDVVCLNNLHSHFVSIPKLLSYLGNKKIPTVLVLHDCWFYTGYCTHYIQIECEKWKKCCGRCEMLRRERGSLFFDGTKEMFLEKQKCYSEIDKLAVVGVSNWITNEARQSSIFPNHTLFKTIYNWVDLSLFCKKDCKKDDVFSITVESTKWFDSKNKHICDYLLKNLPDDCRVVIIGSVNKKNLHTLSSKEIATGYLNDPNKLADVLNESDCYLHMSYEDSFGKINAEAMACGTPVIVYNNTALPEFIDNDRCGYVVSPKNPEEILQAVLRIRDNGKSFYSDDCIVVAKNKYAYQKVCDRYLNLFKEMIK